ncbi:MAG: hypothetical protein MJ224_02265 [archaeon]|nr:hypothetical protein [archaeon]
MVNITDDGREIGIYKNNVLHKYTYDCSVSGATNLVNNVLYFVSLEGSSYSLQNFSSVSQIRSSGISLFCDGRNVLISYYGYAVDDINGFNVVFDGKTSGDNHICNVSLYSGLSNVGSFYFSSEKNVDGYAPVYTNLTLFNKFYNVNSIYYVDSVSEDNWEYLYYGDTSYGDYLSNADWSSSLGYEAVQSYLISGGKITDSDMSSYLANVSDYSGVESVVYENFLIALAYEWLDCKLADELALEYDVGWSKYGESLVSAFVGVNGRFISVLGTIRGNSGLNFQEFNNMYYLYGSLLEEYVMGLTGYNSTCAVSEVFKGLLNGEEFYYYYDSENLCTVLKLADNSSWLEFSDLGGIGSIINISALRNKYNGGMCLGDFSYDSSISIIDNMQNILNRGVHVKLLLLNTSFVDLEIKVEWTEEQWDQAYSILGDVFISASGTCLMIDLGLLAAAPTTEGLSIILTLPVTYMAIGTGCVGLGFKALANDVDQDYGNMTRWKMTTGDSLSSYLLATTSS